MKIRWIDILGLTVALSASTAFAAGPIAPSDQTKSQIKTIPKVIPDLPYKPSDPNAPLTEDTSLQEPAVIESKKEFDWSKLPFIPSKSPALKPAPDPEPDDS